MNRHLFGLERPGQLGDVLNISDSSVFQPLPKPTGVSPYRLDLKNVLSSADFARIARSKKMVFHCAGDVGGVKNPADQILVTDHMEMQFDKINPQNNPSFFYILGDVVYYYGKAGDYYSQFYDPYKFYPAPVFAIPGNHDGDVDPTDAAKPASLEAFVKFFCSQKPLIPPESGDAPRTTMIQPNVYWTLVTPVATIIGLYTNVPSGGHVADDQKQWFIKELINANKERSSKALIVTLHHPPYSLDLDHGASVAMQQLLDDSFKQSKVWPDIVLYGHVHNYQRFTRNVSKKQIPYIVAGSGGYWFLHSINSNGQHIPTPSATPFANVTLEKYVEDRHGFMRIAIDMNIKKLLVEFFTVPRSHEPWKSPPILFDSFSINLTNNKLE